MAQTPTDETLQVLLTRMRSAFLRYVQAGNQCGQSGMPCRDECGCWLEMQDAINSEVGMRQVDHR